MLSKPTVQGSPLEMDFSPHAQVALPPGNPQTHTSDRDCHVFSHVCPVLVNTQIKKRARQQFPHTSAQGPFHGHRPPLLTENTEHSSLENGQRKLRLFPTKHA